MTERSVRIGVSYLPQHFKNYQNIRAAIRRGEDAGIDVAFNWDHFYPLSGDPVGEHLECWTMLAAWAEETTRIEFGALVTSNTYRNPDLLADMARTVDHISAKDGTGRLILGIGSGWKQQDHDEYGYEFGTIGSRLDLLGESLPRIENRFAKLNPPATRDIPILIGGGGERKTLKLVAKHADIWHVMNPAAIDYDHKLEVLQQWCTEVGRPFEEIELSVGFLAFHDYDEALLDSLYDKGARFITLGADGPDYIPKQLDKFLAWRDRRNA